MNVLKLISYSIWGICLIFVIGGLFPLLGRLQLYSSNLGQAVSVVSPVPSENNTVLGQKEGPRSESSNLPLLFISVVLIGVGALGLRRNFRRKKTVEEINFVVPDEGR